MKKLLLILLLILVSLPGCAAYERVSDLFTTNLDASGIITYQSEELLLPAYGETYISTSSGTTCTVAGTYYLVGGTTTPTELLRFTGNAAGRLTYTGSKPNRVCLVTATLSGMAPPASVPCAVGFRIYVNGAPDLPSTTHTWWVASNVSYSTTVTTIVTLQTNDYVEVYVTCSVAGTVIKFGTMNLAAVMVD